MDGIGLDNAYMVLPVLWIVGDENIANSNFTRKSSQHTNNIRACADILVWIRFIQTPPDISVGIRCVDRANFAPSEVRDASIEEIVDDVPALSGADHPHIRVSGYHSYPLLD